MKTFFFSKVLYKQRMCDIFEVYDVFTVYTKEPKTLTFASSKYHEFIFTRIYISQEIFMLFYFHHQNQ